MNVSAIKYEDSAFAYIVVCACVRSMCSVAQILLAIYRINMVTKL